MAFATYTLAELRSRLAARYEAVPFWSDDQANRAIAETLRVWNALTGTWVVTRTVDLVPGDPYVGLSGLLTKATRVLDSDGFMLDPTSLTGLDRAFRDWEITTTAGQPRYWAPVSLSALAVYPAPDAVGRTLTVRGIGAVTIPTADADTIDIGSEEFDTLLGYALHVLAFTQGSTALEASMGDYTAFYRAAAQRNAVLASSSVFRRVLGLDRTRLMQPGAAAEAVDTPVVPS